MDAELIKYVESNNAEGIIALLKSGVDNDSVLRWATLCGHVEIVNDALKSGADVHSENDYALIQAIRQEHLGIVDLLLKNGANVHARDDAALCEAAEKGHVEILMKLLEYNADNNAINAALSTASTYGHTEIVDVLLQHGANVHHTNDKALRNSAVNNRLDVLNVLLKHEANVHPYDDEALRQSSAKGYAEIVMRLLECGANVRACENASLVEAAKNGHAKVVTALLKHGADVHARDDRALHQSAQGDGHKYLRRDRGQIIPASTHDRYLWSNHTRNRAAIIPIDSVVGPKEENIVVYAYTAGRDANRNNYLNTVTALIEHGADVNSHDDYALRVSIANENWKIAAKLLECGANVRCNNREILTSLQKNFNEAVADLLLPYCGTEDYCYFPSAYIRERIVPTKGARSA